MKKIPKEMKVVIIGMLIECIILYGVYKVNTVDKVSSTKDNTITYSNLDKDEECDDFTDDDKKKISYDYNVPLNNKVCKILDEDTLLVTDNNKIKEYNYKTKQYEKYWGEIEEGYELKQVEKYKNRLFYSAVKFEKGDNESNNKNYFFRIKCIDKDTGKELVIFNSKEPEMKQMEILLKEEKLIILRYVYNRYEIGYVESNVERFKYKLIYADNDRNNRYSINNIYVNDNKLYWNRYEKYNASSEVNFYNFEDKNIEVTELPIDGEYFYNDKILFYKDEYSTIRVNNNSKSNNDFFNKGYREEKFEEAIKKYKDQNKEVFQEYNNFIDDRNYIIDDWKLYEDKLLLKVMIPQMDYVYFIYDFNKDEFINVNMNIVKGIQSEIEILDIKDNTIICDIYLKDKKNKMTILKKI